MNELTLILIWNNWLLTALAACLLYAVDSLLDCIFVNNKVYSNPIQGTIITCLFSGLCLIALPVSSIEFTNSNLTLNLIGICSGMLYSLYIYFYLKALSCLNDAANIKTFLGFRVFMLPIFAALLLGESLLNHEYVGIFIALIGILILAFSNFRYRKSKYALSSIQTAVTLLSISMIVQAQLYTTISFIEGFTLFIIGRVLGGLLFWLANYNPDIFLKIKTNFFSLFFAKLTGFVAVFLSHRAISLSPSVSFVAVIESLVPVLIMLLCVLLIPFSHFKFCNKTLRPIIREHLHQSASKLFAAMFIVLGVLVINGNIEWVDKNLVALIF